MGKVGRFLDGQFVPENLDASTILSTSGTTAEEHISNQMIHVTQDQVTKIANAALNTGLTAEEESRKNADLAEAAARTKADNDLQSQIDAEKGQTRRYLIDFDVEFGVDTPTKTQTDAWLAGRTPSLTPDVGTAFKNSNTSQSTYNHLFVYYTDPDDPTGLILQDDGLDTVSTASTTSLGVVRGNGDIYVDANGDMRINLASVTDTMIAEIELVDNDGSSVLVPVDAKGLVDWLQGIRDNLKGALNQGSNNDTQLTSHVNNIDVHVTADQKQSWESKASTDVVTATSNGLMEATDKVKLNGVATGATADSKTTTIPKMNGAASIGTETTYAAGDHVHPVDTSRAPYVAVTTTVNGLMLATDKVKLDSLSNPSIVTTTTNGLMLAADKAKLDGLDNPTVATSTTLGLVKSGGNVTVSSDGTMNASGDININNWSYVNILGYIVKNTANPNYTRFDFAYAEAGQVYIQFSVMITATNTASWIAATISNAAYRPRNVVYGLPSYNGNNVDAGKILTSSIKTTGNIVVWLDPSREMLKTPEVIQFIYPMKLS